MYDPSTRIQAAACLMNRLPKIDDDINWATRELPVAIGNNGSISDT